MSDKMENRFNNADSQKLKGLAILFMMWHHCFLAGRFDAYSFSTWPLSVGQLTNIAVFMKICVSLFVFVSGYGLFKSLDKQDSTDIRSSSLWLKDRLIKLLKNYWFIVIIAWIVCQIIDGRTLSFYFVDGHVIKGIWNMIIEFFGVSTLFGNAQLCGTWWYMSAAVLIVVLAPAAYALLKKFGSLFTVLLFLIGPHLIWHSHSEATDVVAFLGTFIIGMVFAKDDLFKKFHEFKGPFRNDKLAWTIKFIFMLVMLIICYKLYLAIPLEKWWGVKFAVIPTFVILFAVEYLDRVPVISHILSFIGMHSNNVFLVHTFIRYYYCESFTYTKWHFIPIMVILLGISIIISYVIMGLQRVTRYDRFISRFLNNSAKEKKTAKNC